MNLLFMAGSILLGWTVAAQTTTSDTTEIEPDSPRISSEVPETRALLDQIVFIETEEEVALNFDTAVYLPERFDPYVGVMDDIAYIPIDKPQQVAMGFDVYEYLPEGFEPYLGDLSSLVYKVEQEPVAFDFDTKTYLPSGFDAYLGNYNDLVFVEEQPEILLGFDTAAYLPRKFDPHVGDLDAILYEELGDISPGFCHGISETETAVF